MPTVTIGNVIHFCACIRCVFVWKDLRIVDEFKWLRRASNYDNEELCYTTHRMNGTFFVINDDGCRKELVVLDNDGLLTYEPLRKYEC